MNSPRNGRHYGAEVRSCARTAPLAAQIRKGMNWGGRDGALPNLLRCDLCREEEHYEDNITGQRTEPRAQRVKVDGVPLPDFAIGLSFVGQRATNRRSTGGFIGSGANCRWRLIVGTSWADDEGFLSFWRQGGRLLPGVFEEQVHRPSLSPTPAVDDEPQLLGHGHGHPL